MSELVQLDLTVTWQSFDDDSILSYVPLDREPILDRRGGGVKLRIGNGVIPGGIEVQDGAIGNILPPNITAPIDGTVELALNATIQCAAFSGVTGDLEMDGHASAFWEVSLNASFTNIVASKYVISGDLLTLDLSTLDAPLVKATEYWIRARFTSVSGTQSQHSSPIRIVTVYPSPAIAGRLTGPFAEDVGVVRSSASTVMVVGGGGIGANPTDFGSVAVYIKDSLGLPTHQQTIVPGLYQGVQQVIVREVASGDINGNVLVFPTVNVDQANVDYSSFNLNIYVRIGTVWTHVQTLPAGASPADIVLSDKYIAVGTVAGGNIATYARNGVSWSRVGDVIATGYTNNYLSTSRLVLRDNQLLVGAPDYNNYIGRVYQYDTMDSGTTWVESRVFEAPAGVGEFGHCLASTMDTLVVSSPVGTDNGTVRTYRYMSGVWVVEAVLSSYIANAPATGDLMFGRSLAINGNHLAIGSPSDVYQQVLDGEGVQVFRRKGNVWEPIAYMENSGYGTLDHHNFGASLAYVGESLFISEPGSDSVQDAYVYLAE